MNDPTKLLELLREAQDLRVHKLAVTRDGSFQVEFFPGAAPLATPAPQRTPEQVRQQQIDDDLAAVEGGP